MNETAGMAARCRGVRGATSSGRASPARRGAATGALLSSVLAVGFCTAAGPAAAQTTDAAALAHEADPLAMPAVGPAVLAIDHYVPHKSSVPSMAGAAVQLYVRERVLAATLARGAPLADRVVLFVHGAGTPAEVAFDVPHEDYSWMAQLAAAGYDVFAMDMTGYGRSTRPYSMNDPCMLSAEQRDALAMPATECSAGTPGPLTTVASDWDDLGAVVEHILTLRDVERVSLIGWSLGGPRAGGYASRHPDKVANLVLLAPAYTRDGPDSATPEDSGAAMTTQSWADFSSNWDRQVGCTDQYDPAVARAVWADMLASDPVGAAWGLGVRRAPRTAVWGFNAGVAARIETPTLLVAAEHDRQIVPQRVRDLFEDLGAADKVLIELGCASHNAMWETAHTTLFDATLAWLRDGAVQGTRQGVVQLGR